MLWRYKTIDNETGNDCKSNALAWSLVLAKGRVDSTVKCTQWYWSARFWLLITKKKRLCGWEFVFGTNGERKTFCNSVSTWSSSNGTWHLNYGFNMKFVLRWYLSKNYLNKILESFIKNTNSTSFRMRIETVEKLDERKIRF